PPPHSAGTGPSAAIEAVSESARGGRRKGAEGLDVGRADVPARRDVAAGEAVPAVAEHVVVPDDQALDLLGRNDEEARRAVVERVLEQPDGAHAIAGHRADHDAGLDEAVAREEDVVAAA